MQSVTDQAGLSTKTYRHYKEITIKFAYNTTEHLQDIAE